MQTHVLLVTPFLHQSPEERDHVVDILHVTELPHARTDYTMALCQNIFIAVAAFKPLLVVLVDISKIPWYIFTNLVQILNASLAFSSDLFIK